MTASAMRALHRQTRRRYLRDTTYMIDAASERLATLASHDRRRRRPDALSLPIPCPGQAYLSALKERAPSTRPSMPLATI